MCRRFNGQPVALLTRLPRRSHGSPLGRLKGKIRMAADFDAPLEEFTGYLC